MLPYDSVCRRHRHRQSAIESGLRLRLAAAGYAEESSLIAEGGRKAGDRTPELKGKYQRASE